MARYDLWTAARAQFSVVHLIWEGMEKGHIDHTNTMALPQRVGGYSFSFKKKCQLGLIYDMQSTRRSTTPLFWALLLGQCNGKKNKKQSTVSPITSVFDNTSKRKIVTVLLQVFCSQLKGNKSSWLCYKDQENRDSGKWGESDALRCWDQCHVSQL